GRRTRPRRPGANYGRRPPSPAVRGWHPRSAGGCPRPPPPRPPTHATARGSGRRRARARTGASSRRSRSRGTWVVSYSPGLPGAEPRPKGRAIWRVSIVVIALRLRRADRDVERGPDRRRHRALAALDRLP